MVVSFQVGDMFQTGKKPKRKIVHESYFCSMIKGNNIVFSLIMLAFLSIVGKVSAHPFYVSVSEIRIDTQKSTLNVSCRLFTDDLENALTKIYNNKFDLLKTLDEPTVHKNMDEYFQKRFSIGIAGVLQTLSFVGMEKEDEALWCYWESTNFKSLGNITVTNALLYDFLPDQINIIHLYVNAERQSARLVNPEKVAGFK